MLSGLFLLILACCAPASTYVNGPFVPDRLQTKRPSSIIRVPDPHTNPVILDQEQRKAVDEKLNEIQDDVNKLRNDSNKKG